MNDLKILPGDSKKILITLLISIFLIILFGCEKDKEEQSFVDDYNPTLTEAVGTNYNGEFLPFGVGYSWYWNGESTTSGTIEGMKTNGSDYVSGYMNVIEQKEISLPSGSYEVFHTSETEGIERYFEKTDTSVNLRAVKNTDGSGNLIEVKNPCYLKNPLIVGQKWNAQPQIDPKLLETLGSMDMSELKINCKFYVIGKEKVTWNNKITETVRVDERAEATGKLHYSESGTNSTINLNVTICVTLNLLENIGIVNQKQEININTSGDLNMNLNIVTNAGLSNYSFSNYSSLQEESALKAASMNTVFNNKILKFLKLIKSVSI